MSKKKPGPQKLSRPGSNDLQAKNTALEKELVAVKAQLAQAGETLTLLQTRLRNREHLIKELEGKLQGWRVEHSFLERIEAASTVEEATRMLLLLESQEGFLGGRVLHPGIKYDTPRLQTFWQDDDPPSTTLCATIRNEELPEGLRHVLVPPPLQKSLFMIRPFRGDI